MNQTQPQQSAPSSSPSNPFISKILLSQDQFKEANRKLLEKLDSRTPAYPSNALDSELSNMISKVTVQLKSIQQIKRDDQNLIKTLDEDFKAKWQNYLKDEKQKRNSQQITRESELKKQIQLWQKKCQNLQKESNQQLPTKIDQAQLDSLKSVNRQLLQSNQNLKLEHQNLKEVIEKNKNNKLQFEKKLKQEVRKLTQQLSIQSQNSTLTQKKALQHQGILKCIPCLELLGNLKKLSQIPSLKKKIESDLNKLTTLDRSDPEAIIDLFDSTQFRNNFNSILDEIVKLIKSLESKFATSNAELEKKQRQFSEKINSLEQKNKQSVIDLGSEKQKIISDFEEKIRLLEKNKLEKTQQLNASLKSIQNYKKQISDLKQDKGTLEKTLETQKQKVITLAREKKDLQSVKSQLQTKIRNMQAEAKRKQTEKEQSERTYNEKILKLEKQLKEAKEANRKLNSDYSKLSSDLDESKKQVQSQKKKIYDLKKQLQKKDRELRDERNEKDRITQVSQIITEQKEEFAFKFKDQTMISSSLENQNKQLKQMLSRVSAQLQDAQGQLRDERKFSNAFRLLNDSFFPELSYRICREKVDFDMSNPDRSLNHLLQFFEGKYNQAKYFAESDIVSRDQVDYLIDEVKTFTGRTVMGTKMFYKHDPKNLINFHNYVDGKDNVMVLIKLVNNFVLGGFSTLPLQKGKTSYSGFLFNLTLARSFFIRKNPKSSVLPFDDFYFIFGNSEMRIKPNEMKLFSNFGVNTSTFDNMGLPRKDFLGVEKATDNDIEALTFEFYQITLG